MRAVPGSTTYRMPGTVIEVSATFVASTTRRPPPGAKTRCCSAALSRAYSGSTVVTRSSCGAQGVGHVVDLALAGEEHQHVPVAGGQALEHGVADGVHVVGRPTSSVGR